MLAKWVVHYLTLWFPGIFASNRGIVESVLLFPLQCYEAVIVLPVSFFRNHIAWTHRLFRKAINLSETTFYQQLLESMLQFIELETEFFAVKK